MANVWQNAMQVGNAFSDLKASNNVGGSLGSSNVFDGLGNFFTGNLDYQRQYQLMQEEMKYNAIEAQKNRDFQQKMSETEYQRAVEDMRKAGLNPYLALTNGGNSVPTGSAASVGPRQSTSSGRGFAAILGIIPSLISGMVSSSNAMMNANNAMQIAKIKDFTTKETARLGASNAMEIAKLKDRTERAFLRMYQEDRKDSKARIKGFRD